MLTLWGVVFILSLVCPILMSDPVDGGIGPSNVFFMLSGFAVIAVFYVWFAMIETMGLSDKQKKLIFTPKKFLLEDDTRESTMKAANDQPQFQFDGNSNQIK